MQGKTDFKDVKEMADGPEYYKTALDICHAILSAETPRQRLDNIDNPRCSEILETNVEMFALNEVKPTPENHGFAPLDIDVTPLDNYSLSKEGVSCSYKGG